MKVDFRKIKTLKVDGSERTVDMSKTLGTIIHDTSVPREDMDLGKEIYSLGEVEVNKQRASIIKKYIMNGNFFAYIREGIVPILDKIINEKESLDNAKAKEIPVKK